MKGAALASALLVMSLTGCTGEPSAGPVDPAPPIPIASATDAASPPPTLSVATGPRTPTAQKSPSVEPKATPSHDHGPVVVLSDNEVAGVAFGTAAAEAERRLRAALGAPTHADSEPGCNGEKGRQLIWGEGELVVYMLAEGGAGAALSGWSASRTQRFDYRFPYGTRLGESAAATQRRVPGATGRALTEGDYAESYVVETPERPGLLWAAKGASARGPVYEVAYNPVGCD